MRAVRLSLTAQRLFQTMLAQGAMKFGVDVADEKRRLVEDFIRGPLAEFPHRGYRDPGSKLHHYSISKTPFTVVYDYDSAELRVLFIVHNRADRRRLDPIAVEW